MDRDKIRKALDHFENDEFVDAKDIIQGEIAGKRDVFLKDKIGLANDINPAQADANADASGGDADGDGDGDGAGAEGDE
jgi:hypothetical protein